MSTAAPRPRSPVAALLAGGGARQAAALGLKDASHLPRLGIKGPGLLPWLAGCGVEAPAAVLGVLRPEAAALVVRSGGDEVMVQADPASGVLARLEAGLGDADGAGVYRLEQQGGTFFVRGAGAPKLWSQTCAVELAARPADAAVFTRVAGISCAVIAEQDGAGRAYRVWVEYGLAPDLWQTLRDILAGG